MHLHGTGERLGIYLLAFAGRIMMSRSFKTGDAVVWDSSQGEVLGRVVKKLTSRTRIKTHFVAATPEKPEYLVRSSQTGALAAHRPEAVRPRRR